MNGEQIYDAHCKVNFKRGVVLQKWYFLPEEERQCWDSLATAICAKPNPEAVWLQGCEHLIPRATQVPAFDLRGCAKGSLYGCEMPVPLQHSDLTDDFSGNSGIDPVRWMIPR